MFVRGKIFDCKRSLSYLYAFFVLKPGLTVWRDIASFLHQHRYCKGSVSSASSRFFFFAPSIIMSRSTSSPFGIVDSSPPEVISGLRNRFNAVMIQPGTVSGSRDYPAVSVAFGGDSPGRNNLLLPNMQGPGNTGHDGGQHPDDQSGKSLSDPVHLDSTSRGFNSESSPSAEVGTIGDGSTLASATRFSFRTNIPAPGRYNEFVKTGLTTTGIKSATLVKLFLVPVGSLGNTLCGGRIGESGLQACISSTSPSSSGCAIQRHVVKETRLMEGTMYIPSSSSFGKLSVFLEPSLSVIALPPSKVHSLLLEERSAEA